MAGGTIGAQLVMLLEQYGVTLAFGIPGVHTIELYRALAGSRLRHVTPRHEQAAGFMADGYARVSGRPGVCFLITGPGVTNAATAMAQAYADSVPMLVISTVAPVGALGRGGGFLHELPDQRALMRQVAAFSHTVLSADELPEALARAFALFAAGRPRPVHIEIPMNLVAAPAVEAARRLGEIAPAAPRAQTLAQVAEWCADAISPVLLIGGGARRAAAEVARLAERLDAPTVLTINARGLLPPDHPLQVSFSPTELDVRRLVARSDLVFAIGTELGATDYDIFDDGGFLIPGRLVRVDIDPQQAVRGRIADLTLVGDASVCVELLLDALGPSRGQGAGAARAAAVREQAWARLDALTRAQIRLLERVRDALPGAILVGDSTQLVYAGNTGFAASAARTWFNSATGYGTLGYGLPAAIGAALASPASPVVCLVGDGGLQFSLAELGTAIEAGVAPILLLLNNSGYGEIKSSMLRAGVEPLGVDLVTPDFAAIAQAYGWRHQRLEGPAALEDALHAARGSRRPSLIEFGPRLFESMAQR